MLWAAAPGRRCAELSGNTASKASAENAIKISRALMAWLYSHWRRSSSQSEGLTVQFCVSWFAGKAPAKKLARDRQSVETGQRVSVSVDLGGRGTINNK